MYSLKEYWQLRDLPLPKGEWDGNVICLETNVEWTFGANETHGFLSCYTFTIVTSGWVTIIYHNSEITLNEGDLYTYSPGMEVTVLSASEDYRGICLLADERFTLSLSMVRNAVRTAYFNVVELTSPVLSLKPDDLCRLRELMLMAIRYQQSGITHSNESLQMLYSLFLLDLSAIQEHSIREHRLIAVLVVLQRVDQLVEDQCSDTQLCIGSIPAGIAFPFASSTTSTSSCSWMPPSSCARHP